MFLFLVALSSLSRVYKSCAVPCSSANDFFARISLGELRKTTKIAWPRDKTIENAFYDENWSSYLTGTSCLLYNSDYWFESYSEKRNWSLALPLSMWFRDATSVDEKGPKENEVWKIVRRRYNILLCFSKDNVPVHYPLSIAGKCIRVSNTPPKGLGELHGASETQIKIWWYSIS